MGNMCDKKDIKQASSEAIKEYLTTKDSDGLTPIEKEMKESLDSAISKITIKFGVAFAVTVFTAGGAWYSLYGEVQDNTDARQEGGRYTLEDHNIYAEQIDNEIEDVRRDFNNDLANVKDDIDEIKGDVKYIIKQLGG